jgi:hypothetical protein
MKYSFTSLFILLIFICKSQNSVSTGLITLKTFDNNKNWSFVPNINYALTFTDRKALQIGVGYLFNTYKKEFGLLPINNSFTSDEKYTITYTSNAPSVYGDYKYYVIGNHEIGGFYFQFGMAAYNKNLKKTVSMFDTTYYRYSVEDVPGSITKYDRSNQIVTRFILGYEIEVADLLNLYFETGLAMGGYFAYTTLNFGIRKIFLKL